MVGGAGTGRVTYRSNHGRQRRRRQQVHHHQHVHQHRHQSLTVYQAAPTQPVEQPRMAVTTRPAMPVVPTLPMTPTMRDLYAPQMYRPTYAPVFRPVYAPVFAPSTTSVRSYCPTVHATQSFQAAAPQPVQRQDDSFSAFIGGIFAALAVGAAVLGSGSSGSRKRR